MSDPVNDKGASMPSNSDELFIRPRTVEVRSATEPTISYTVTLPYCECRGFHFRGTCSHVLTAIREYAAGAVVEKQHISKTA